MPVEGLQKTRLAASLCQTRAFFCYNPCRPSQSPSQHTIKHNHRRHVAPGIFLLWLGKYAYTPNPEATPFLLNNVHILHGLQCLDYTASETFLNSATHVALELDSQKMV
jgi:hypothetical protein